MAQLLKVHGSMNQFFLLDQTQFETPIPAATLVDFTQKITAKSGLLGGADGVLVVDHDDQAAGRMTVINADGTYAKMCGNGLRTVSRYLAAQSGQSEFLVQTAETALRVHQSADLAKGVPAFGVEISPVTFNAASLPFAQLGHDEIIDQVLPEIHPSFKFTAIAVPNPHLIAFVSQDELNGEAIGEIGRRLNAANPYFPEGVNVTFAAIMGRKTIFARTYERGVGFTNACGTGMSATSLALVLTHPEVAKLDDLITVYNPGGKVQTNVHRENGQYWIELIGNATFTHTIEIPEANLRAGSFADAQVTETGEQAAYEAFVASLPVHDLVKTI